MKHSPNPVYAGGPTGKARGARAHPAGFSLIELVFALMIAAILMGIALPAFGDILNRRELNDARDSFIYLSARARAEVIRRGGRVELELDANEDRAFIVRGTDTLEIIDYDGERFRAEVSAIAADGTGTSEFELCYLPRGFTEQSDDCSWHGTVLFASGGDTARARVGALGEVERP